LQRPLKFRQDREDAHWAVVGQPAHQTPIHRRWRPRQNRTRVLYYKPFSSVGC